MTCRARRLAAAEDTASWGERKVWPRVVCALALVTGRGKPRSAKTALEAPVDEGQGPHGHVWQFAARHLLGEVGQRLLDQLADLVQAQEAVGGEEPLPGGVRVGHGQNMRHGDVAHIADREADLGGGRIGAGAHEADDLVRGRKVGVGRRPEHEGRIDDRQLRRAGRVPDELPRGPLGQRLRHDVGRYVGTIRVGPVGLIEHVSGLRLRPGKGDGDDR